MFELCGGCGCVFCVLLSCVGGALSWVMLCSFVLCYCRFVVYVVGVACCVPTRLSYVVVCVCCAALFCLLSCDVLCVVMRCGVLLLCCVDLRVVVFGYVGVVLVSDVLRSVTMCGVVVFLFVLRCFVLCCEDLCCVVLCCVVCVCLLCVGCVVLCCVVVWLWCVPLCCFVT